MAFKDKLFITIDPLQWQAFDLRDEISMVILDQWEGELEIGDTLTYDVVNRVGGIAKCTNIERRSGVLYGTFQRMR